MCWKMIKAVFDTNVFLSALFWGGRPKEALELALSKKVQGITSKAILLELEEKLLDKFGFPKEKTARFIKIISGNFEVVQPKKKLYIVKEDPNDNKIFEVAMESRAEYIISGDKHLLNVKRYQNIKVLTPKEFQEKVT